ncbi:ATP-dependent sacrificial sulfur transferase LarE [Romboutsia maritimum]|uniref:ATP-dependent sacrificial sulfur transferase LarE n=1 Tax=Romboutsia maritimum TaxID=2020948 RepID=A0A371IUS8_9FIRM|nr:ATP-dependent sacrificial sulfur transferase LarE [Romboutsia maritimum]RDY24240.1 ATP-dependent sacrificial sulfur transferase LarE [Romboutsia maritimum]
MNLNEKLNLLKKKLTELESVAVAYSGGVDSNFLLKVAKDTLKDKVIAVTINAMMHSNKEISESKEYAKLFNVNQIVVDINEFKIEGFINNGQDRCYYCKKEVFSIIKKVAKDNNIKYILDGTNLSDLGDYRPGLRALEELDIVSPLKDCEFTKEDIRALSKDMGLKTFNKPAFACLATRIPYGTKITNDRLRMIEKSEDYLVELGFNQFRVRIHEDIARIEVEKDEIYKFFSNDILDKTNNKLKELGFKYVTLDMAGYKMGNMNIGIKK